MKSALKYVVFRTHAGWVGCLASASGLVRTTLPHPSAAGARADLGDLAGAVESPAALATAQARLVQYFEGQRVSFPFPLDFARATPFQQAVWQATRRIAYGEARTYGWVAREAGNAAAFRAAGQALGRNPLPIIVPCHRVIAADGGLGGFGGGTEGLDMKRRLLKLEGCL